MIIKNLKLKNFCAFEDIDVDFSPKINIIIGENGTGKTQLLKSIYYAIIAKKEIAIEDLGQHLAHTLVQLFKPIDDKLGKLKMTGGADKAQITAITDDRINGPEVSSFSFDHNSKFIQFDNPKNKIKAEEAIFFPTKEVLSFMRGFISLYDKYDLAFDSTYRALCSLLELPELKEDHLHEKSKWAIQEIEKICGGKFLFQGGGEVRFQKGSTEYSSHMIAEGFRKAGILSRLLKTGSIQPGVSGPLLWDEPEANLNPRLLRSFAEIMLELSRGGQQIIIATHEYILLKWFDLLEHKGFDDEISFHTFYRDENNQIRVDSQDSYCKLKQNAISDTYAELYDEDVKRALGQ